MTLRLREDPDGGGGGLLIIDRPEAQARIERPQTREHREGVAAFRAKRRPDCPRAASA